MTARLQAPSGAPPPSRARIATAEVDLEPLAHEICARYRAMHPDEQTRYGDAGQAWCIHDTLYLLAWAADDVTLGSEHLIGNVNWLARVLDARQFPTDRLARHLDIASDVVLEARLPRAHDLAERLRVAGRRVLAGVAPDNPAASSPVRNAYLAALLRADPASARRVIDAAVDTGMTFRELYLSVFQEALYEVGRLWQIGEATVAQEHLATATTQTLMSRLSVGPASVAGTGRRALTTGTQDDLHSLGARFLADFLEADGWTVIDLGAGSPTEDIIRLVKEVKPTVVCLSTTLTTNLIHAKDTVAALRELTDRPLIAVGGHAYGGSETQAAAIGADLWAADADQFARILRNHFPRR
jgi:MerR family transcriptional regulator, light-induced transcriptional regulator